MVIRSQELKKLEGIYNKSGNNLVLMYGARGCQKEQLLQLFINTRMLSIELSRYSAFSLM